MNETEEKLSYINSFTHIIQKTIVSATLIEVVQIANTAIACKDATGKRVLKRPN